MPPAHTLTLIQYRDAHRDDYYDRTPDALIRRQVCDDLYRRAPLAWRVLVHDFGTDWLPAGYLNPDVRKVQR